MDNSTKPGVQRQSTEDNESKVIWQNECQNFQSKVRYLYNKSIWTDCTIVIKFKGTEQWIEAHKLVLATASCVFADTLYGDKSHYIFIIIKEFPADVIKDIVRYIYTDDDIIDRRSFSRTCVLHMAAQKYQLEFLKRLTWAYITENINSNNCISAFEVAVTYEDDVLKELCTNIFKKETMGMFASEEFLNASLNTIHHIYSMENLNISSELHMFDALERYQMHNSPLFESGDKNKDVLLSAAAANDIVAGAENVNHRQNDATNIEGKKNEKPLSHKAREENKEKNEGFKLRDNIEDAKSHEENKDVPATTKIEHYKNLNVDEGLKIGGNIKDANTSHKEDKNVAAKTKIEHNKDHKVDEGLKIGGNIKDAITIHKEDKNVAAKTKIEHDKDHKVDEGGNIKDANTSPSENKNVAAKTKIEHNKDHNVDEGLKIGDDIEDFNTNHEDNKDVAAITKIKHNTDQKVDNDTKSTVVTISHITKLIRFLTMTIEEFVKKPAISSLLTQSEIFAIFVNINHPQSNVPMPEGFTKSRKKRFLSNNFDKYLTTKNASRTFIKYEYTIPDWLNLTYGDDVYFPLYYGMNKTWRVILKLTPFGSSFHLDGTGPRDFDCVVHVGIISKNDLKTKKYSFSSKSSGLRIHGSPLWLGSIPDWSQIRATYLEEEDLIFDVEIQISSRDDSPF